MNALFGGMIADPASGTFINQKHAAVAQIVNDWNPELFLVWIPRDARLPGDEHKEFAVIHRPGNRPEYIVRYVDEADVNERLVAWLYENDTKRTDVLSRLEYAERAERLLTVKMQEDAAAERQDMIATVIKSPLHTYTLENGRKIRS